MQISKTNNVIFMKDVESNMIDQAFIILKDNVKIEFRDNNEKIKAVNEINIIKDAENLINNEINKKNIEFEKFKCEKLNRKIKILKVINIITVIMFVIFILIK